MQPFKLLLVALLLTIPALGCGSSKAKPAEIKELTKEQIAEQNAALKEVEEAERIHRKNTPPVKTPDQLAEEAERARRR